ncbi:MAG: hypothetical protein AAF367_06255 [Pseudomonadota bacterium]
MGASKAVLMTNVLKEKFKLPKMAGTAQQVRRLMASNSAFVAASILSVIWLGGVIAYAAGFFGFFEAALLTPRRASALEIALFFLAALAPITLFFYGALLAYKAEEIRVETARLSSAIDALRVAVLPRSVPAAPELADALTKAARSTLAEEKAALSAALSQIDGALAETQSMMDRIEGRESEARRIAKRTGQAQRADREQPALPFGTDTDVARANHAGIPWDSVVQALDFPRDASDKQGFETLRNVVTDREFAELLQAAEDALTLLAEDGLYMEDLEPEIAPLELWMEYAEGTRGRRMSPIGGVTDEVALAITRGRLRNDSVFRDAALHFLRRFDRLLERMMRELGRDAMILDVANTRTGRAFMVIARITGVFD